MASEPSSYRGPRDRVLLASTRAARGFGAGALSIVLALELASAGYSPFLVGGLLGIAMAGASAWSLLIPRFERWIGRRRVFLVNAAALSFGGFLLWLDLSSIWVVGVALLLGGIVAGTADISPLGALEQATLADATPDRRRTVSFSQYNLVGYVGNAFGALAAGPLTAASLPVPGGFPTSPRDLALLFYALLGVALIPVYSALSKGVSPAPEAAPSRPLTPRSRSIILSLSGLFSVDAFGGGLIVNSLVTYYLAVRFHPSVAVLGVVFFAGNLAAALSLVAAVPLARRFGLINTMVFTHVPSSVLLIVFAFAPTFLLSAVVWVSRSSLSQMDVPTRQSYTQAVVPVEDRATAAGYTTAARSAQMFGGPVTGAFLEAGGPWLAGPFVLAGSVKIAYDVAVYSRFRRVRPPEEENPPPSVPARDGRRLRSGGTNPAPKGP